MMKLSYELHGLHYIFPFTAGATAKKQPTPADAKMVATGKSILTCHDPNHPHSMTPARRLTSSTVPDSASCYFPTVLVLLIPRTLSQRQSRSVQLLWAVHLRLTDGPKKTKKKNAADRGSFFLSARCRLF